LSSFTTCCRSALSSAIFIPRPADSYADTNRPAQQSDFVLMRT
jgi:hypothetical protein